MFEPSSLLADIRSAEAAFHTPHPVPHPACDPDLCLLRALPTAPTVYVCARDSHNVHLCGYGVCSRSEPGPDDTLVCSLVHIVLADNASAPPLYLPPSAKKKSANNAEASINALDAIVTVIIDAIDASRDRAIVASVAAAMPPDHILLHEYVAHNAFLTAAHLRRWRAAIRALRDHTGALAALIYRIWYIIAGPVSAPTPRRLTFFAIIIFFFFKSGKLLPDLFPQLPAFAVIHSKLAVITHVQRSQHAHRFAPQAITDRQNFYQAAFKAAPPAVRAAVSAAIKDTIPALLAH